MFPRPTLEVHKAEMIPFLVVGVCNFVILRRYVLVMLYVIFAVINFWIYMSF